jgi:hypothetical protein
VQKAEFLWHILDAQTLLVINDNNFPYGGGRALASDATEFLKIRLAAPLSGLRRDSSGGPRTFSIAAPCRHDKSALRFARHCLLVGHVF